MKKIIIILIILLSTIFLVGRNKQSVVKKEVQPTPTVVVKEKTKGVVTEVKKLSLVLDFGEGKISTYAGIKTADKTVLLVLKKVSQEKKIELKIKEYSFGSLVEKIGDKENTKERAWIYFVNGKSADVGADKKEIKDGDIIEWRYIKPIY